MNRKSKEKLVYIRYAFPIVAVVLTFVLMLVPCYSYTTADYGRQEAISLYELLDNSRVQVCEYLFETTGTRDNATVYFSKVVLGLLAGLSVLFAIATAAVVYILISAVRYFKNPEDVGTARILFITLIPNRIVGFALQALVFPLLAFPRIMILLYEEILHYHVELTPTFPDPLILAGILYAASIILSIVSASREPSLHMNPFARRQSTVIAADEDGEDVE